MVPSLDTFPTRGRVRTADVNIDGFPDLYLTLEFQQGKSKFTKSLVLLNEPCTNSDSDITCSRMATEHSRYGLDLPRRFFKVDYKDSSFDSEKITDLAGGDSVLLVPIDFDDDGRMDAIVQRCVKEQLRTYCSLQAIYNNIIYDSFFIKAMMLSQTDTDQGDLGKKMYGANIAGATFRYIVTTLEDAKYVRVAV